MSKEYFQTSKILNNTKIDGGLRKNNIFKKSKKNEPLLTIVTAVFNNEKFLEESILSLHNQKYANYEHIVIDGGSTDGTIDIIKKYEDKIDYWCSEKDKGIYDAFNKGMKLASGEYIGFLNSDDKYSDNAFEILIRYIKENTDKDFIFGAVKKHWGILYGYKPYKIYWSWGFYSSHSTGFFIKTESAKKVGLYNLKYKFSADYDLFYRMIVKLKMKGMATKKNEIMGHFRTDGLSSRIKYIDYLNENTLIRLDNGQNKFIVKIIHFFRYIKRIKIILKQKK